METEGVKVEDELSLTSFITIAVAVGVTKRSRYALKWALEKLVPDGRMCFRLIHVRSKITMVPTPMGNYLPISKVRDDVVSAYKREIEWYTNKMLIPYKKMCAQRQVEVETVVIEADDIAEAISAEVTKHKISKLVLGSSSESIFTRKSKGSNMSATISRCIPSFCTVYVVSKGKLSSVRASTSGIAASRKDESNSSTAYWSCSFSSDSSSAQSEFGGTDLTRNFSLPEAPIQILQNQVFPVNHGFLNLKSSPGDSLLCSSSSLSSIEKAASSDPSVSEIQCCNSSMTLSYVSCLTDAMSCNSDHDSASNHPRGSSFPGNEVNINYELERLRIELGHIQGMFDIAQKESSDASHQLNELSACHMEEAVKLEDMRIREESAREMARQETVKRETAEREAGILRECAEREALLRKKVEESVINEVNEKQWLEKVLTCNDERYKKYTWEEIEYATTSFSETLKIGAGANGIVYKGSFHHTVAAVKVLHSNEDHGTKQFRQELDILGRIRHPHLLLLLGACPDRGCLVYEYMENGSLDDRLRCKNNTPPLPWYHRFRIAWEVASALVFLHNSKPESIVHRDLKPANILLDRNLVSKIGDVGLSTLVPTVNFSTSTMYKDTAPVGTFFYIDPEYQRTGMVSPKSDTYALGMVVLQLLTAKPPMGLAYIVETAMEDDGCLTDVLDHGAGEWPVEETQELALLGLNCLEMRRKDRPDLKDQVLPLLERLKGIADKSYDSAHNASSAPPNHFVCPIFQEVMDDPCVASDGYTYHRKAIEIWLSMNDKSPMSNLKMPNKTLIPNQSLLSAIKDWKSRTR